MDTAVLFGLSLGLAAGTSPGPLLVLVVRAALRSGWRAGVATACAPLVTDVVVVAIAVLVLGQVPLRVVSAVGVVGGLLVLVVSWRTWQAAASAVLDVGNEHAGVAASLRTAAWVNLASPHPWVFWATVMGPLTVSAWRTAPGSAVALVAGFYATLVGVKVILAIGVAAGRRLLTERGYRRALRGSAVLLALAGVALLAEFAPALTA